MTTASFIRRHRVRLTVVGVIAAAAVLAAGTTGHGVIGATSGGTSASYWTGDTGSQVASSNHPSSAPPGGVSGGGSVFASGAEFGDAAADAGDFLSLGGIPQGTGNWGAVIAGGLPAEGDLMAALDATGAGCEGCGFLQTSGSADGTLLAMDGATGGQGGGTATGGGAGGTSIGGGNYAGGGAAGTGGGLGAPSNAGRGAGATGAGNESGSDAGGSNAGGSNAGGGYVPSGNAGTDTSIVAAPVPEPSTYLLMLAGLVAVGTVMRRRRDMIG